MVGEGGDSHIFVCLCVCCVHGTPAIKTHVFKSHLSATVDLKRDSLPPMYCFHHYVCPLVPHGQYKCTHEIVALFRRNIHAPIFP